MAMMVMFWKLEPVIILTRSSSGSVLEPMEACTRA